MVIHFDIFKHPQTILSQLKYIISERRRERGIDRLSMQHIKITVECNVMSYYHVNHREK